MLCQCVQDWNKLCTPACSRVCFEKTELLYIHDCHDVWSFGRGGKIPVTKVHFEPFRRNIFVRGKMEMSYKDFKMPKTTNFTCACIVLGCWLNDTTCYRSWRRRGRPPWRSGPLCPSPSAWTCNRPPPGSPAATPRCALPEQTQAKRLLNSLPQCHTSRAGKLICSFCHHKIPCGEMGNNKVFGARKTLFQSIFLLWWVFGVKHRNVCEVRLSLTDSLSSIGENILTCISAVRVFSCLFHSYEAMPLSSVLEFPEMQQTWHSTEMLVLFWAGKGQFGSVFFCCFSGWDEFCGIHTVQGDWVLREADDDVGAGVRFGRIVHFLDDRHVSGCGIGRTVWIRHGQPGNESSLGSFLHCQGKLYCLHWVN